MFRFGHQDATYTTLLMSTGLTFGTISALFGLTNRIIDQTQYTILVTVVILSAVVPTLIAQTFFLPQQLMPSVSHQLAHPESALAGGVSQRVDEAGPSEVR